MTKYCTIVVDPPWDVKRPTGWSSTANHQSQPYPTMSVGRIAALEVPAAASAWLFLWTVNAFVEDAYAVVRAWGFRPVSLLTWCKEPRGSGPGGAFANTTEFVLYARRGAESLGRLRVADTSWFTWPRRGQSVKPEAFYDLIEAAFPSPRLEMFARRARFGWDYWGDESLGTAALAAHEQADE